VSWVGQIVGNHYRIESEISRGGMATVYRAFQPQLDRWVAIKVLDSGPEGEAFLVRFRKEAKAIAALRHPNILTVYDYGEQEGTAYLVMEYVAGGTLAQLMNGRPMAWSGAIQYVVPIARALAHAHSRKIIHCDVKPGNVLLPRPDWPVLADFGLFQMWGTLQSRETAGLMSGTPAYVSPEQVTGEPVSQQSDIFSLGVIIYELITGQLPFQSVSTSRMMMKRLMEPPPSMSQYAPEVNPALEEVVMRALAREPADRFPTMDNLVDALSQLPLTETMAQFDSLDLRTNTLTTHPQTTGPHLIITGTEAVIPLPLQRQLILGRSDPASAQQPEVNLDPHGAGEAGVSRRHARLWYTAQGWLLEDLDSTNGTYINMAPIKAGEHVKLRHRDVIRCARLTMVFFEE
jgi:serine/threonine protein kinase